jgi:hypothetical protein
MYLWRDGIESRKLRGGADAGFNSHYAACACGRKLGVKKGGCGDAAAAGDKQLGSCAAGKMKYATIFLQ